MSERQTNRFSVTKIRLRRKDPEKVRTAIKEVEGIQSVSDIRRPLFGLLSPYVVVTHTAQINLGSLQKIPGITGFKKG